MAQFPFDLSKRAGRLATDRKVIGWFIVLTLLFAGYTWLQKHPEHNPMAPLDLRDPPGVATNFKIMGLVRDRAECRATLERSAPFRVDVGFSGDGVEVSAGFGLAF